MVPIERRRGVAGRNRSGTASRARGALLALALLAISAKKESAADQEWKAAFNDAREQKRLVFVDFFATWCAPCREMDRRVFSRDDVKEQLANFIVVRLNVDRSSIASAEKVQVLPSYVIYDPSKRPIAKMTGYVEAGLFLDALKRVNSEKDAFLRSATLLDEKQDLDAAFAAAGAYMRLRMAGDARAVLQGARRLAESEGKTARAQMATIQEGFTYSMEGNTKKAVSIIERVTKSPADAATAQLAWLTLGDVYRVANNAPAARAAYRYVQSIAPPASDAYQQAAAALTKLP